MVATETIFFCLVALVALQRLAEMRLSRSNEVWLRNRGAREYASGQLTWMKGVHALWLVAMPIEVVALDRPWVWPIALGALAVFAVGQALRYAAIRALGRHWTVRILVVPGEQVVTGGVFRYVRHPNYLGVALEIVALPLVHGAWLTAVVASLLNGLVLWRRIGAEERALEAETNYADAFRRRPGRPGWRPGSEVRG